MDPIQIAVAFAIGIYLLIMFGISFYVKSRVRDVEDFLVAGRRLSTTFTSATLIATWYGAGTLLTVSDEIKLEGISAALLDPIGAGLCLLIAGLFFARPLWDEKLLTISDLFAKRYGRKAEILSGLVMVPTYFGWIAVQFIALGQLLELFLGFPLALGIPLVALVGTTYTLIGGMWAVTLTDFAQMICLVIGILVIAFMVLQDLGEGFAFAGIEFLVKHTDQRDLLIFPMNNLQEFMDSLGLLVVGSIGNIPGQDLAQRIFSARSANVARKSCFIAGGLYLALGVVPMTMGLAAKHLLPPELQTAVLPALVSYLGSPVLVVLFVVTILSVVLSTIDSALLSPSSVLAQNVIGPYMAPRIDPLKVNRWSVVFVAFISYLTAIFGERAYLLLESAYEMQLVGLFAPMLFALYATKHSSEVFIVGVLSSCGLWILHKTMGWNHLLEPYLYEGLQFPIPASMGITVIVCLFFAAFSRPRSAILHAKP